MSEKRFSLEYCDNMSYVKDNFNDNEYYLYWAVELMNELYEENKRLRECVDEADDIITSHLSDISITYWRNYCKTLGVDL